MKIRRKFKLKKKTKILSMSGRQIKVIAAIVALNIILGIYGIQMGVNAHNSMEEKSDYIVSVPFLPKPPTIDGNFDTCEWNMAVRLSNFIQLEPVEGKSATEQTEVWIGHDDHNLYVAFVAFDSDVGKIRATRTPRDQVPKTDDLVGLLIDPFQTRTRCFFFHFNPLGVQIDGIWSRQYDLSWDNLLTSHGSIHNDRFIVEVAIPFASLLMGASGRPSWDVNLFRFISRKSEESWWAPLKRARRNDFLNQFGQLNALKQIGAKTHIELIPTVTGTVVSSQDTSPLLKASWGLTARMPVSTSAHIEATYKPDFSFVESDIDQICFNERYALFYPEKRPFFLESKDQLETPVASFISEPIRLVHTRTIIKPSYGLRILATPENMFFGGLFTVQDDFDGTYDGTSTVLRAMRRWKNTSQIGLTLTRRAREMSSNLVYAGDALLRLPASSLLTVQVARSISEDRAIGIRRTATAAYVDFAREDSYSFQQIVFRAIPDDFQSEIGFIPRNNLRQIMTHVGVYLRPQNKSLLYILPMIQHIISFDDAGRLIDNEYLPHIELMFTQQTKIWFGYRPGVEVFRGKRYQVRRFEPRFQSSPVPRLDISVKGRFETRVRYDFDDVPPDKSFVADYREVITTFDFKIRRNMSLSMYGVWQFLDGNIEIPNKLIWITRVRASYQFNNKSYVRGIVQWNSDTNSREVSLLAGHVINYGTQFHFGIDYRSDRADSGRKRSMNWMLFVRVSYLFRQ